MIETLVGSITSVGFESGDRFVVGDWSASPIGAFADVMWARPDGSRVLLAAEAVAAYVTSVYPFDEVREQEVSAETEARRVTVRAGELCLSLELGRLAVPFPSRPRLVTATVENLCSSALLGVRTYGISPTGVVEWYRARSLRWLSAATASRAGQDLGSMEEVRLPLGFGFTDPPARPSQVVLRVDLDRGDPW